MAFDTFANIKTSLGNWLNRDDPPSDLADFILLGEDRLARDLRIRGMESALSVTIASGVAAIPSDFLELKHAHTDGNPTYPLELKEAPWIFRKFPIRSSTSRPEFIAVDGTDFIFGPYPDAAYNVTGVYFAKPAALSDTNTTNIWTTYAPDALFFASLSESAPFLGEDQRLVTWEAKYAGIIDGYNQSDKRKMRRGARVSTN